METLVIQNNLLSGGSEKLYRDALVSKGTLFCFDFSNKGCVSNDDLGTVKDLALESKKDLGVIGNVSFDVTDRGVIPPLTLKKGYPIVNLGSYNNNDYDSGLNIEGIDAYLFANQPQNTLAVIWVSAEGEFASPFTGQWIKSSDATTNLRALGGLASLSYSTSNVGVTLHPIPTKSAIQIAIERRGNGMPGRIFINGKVLGDTVGAGGVPFTSPTGNPTSIGVKQPGSDTNMVMFRTFYEDLTVSGRDALEVVMKDYSYVNAINEYSGIEKRPFANL